MSQFWRLLLFAEEKRLNLGAGWQIYVDGRDLVIARGSDVKVRISDEGLEAPINNWNDGEV